MFKHWASIYLLVTTIALFFIPGCAQVAPSQKQSIMSTAVTGNSNNESSASLKSNEVQSTTSETPSTQVETNKASTTQSTQPTALSSKETEQKIVNRNISVPVLYYHSVSSSDPKNPLRMPPKEFEKQMAYLSQHSYHTVSPSQLSDFFNGKGTLPLNPILVTFDDGYNDNYTNALPIIKKFGFTATVFVIVNIVGKNGHMSWGELEELAHEGWQIGSHTLSHSDLTKLDPSKLTREVKYSKELLEDHFGPIKFLAYPSGTYNSKVEKAVKDAGYIMAFTTDRGWANRKTDPLLEHRVYCYATIGMAEFEKRIQTPNY
ncbi:MAG: polysaccharide deacetylase family protein [Desulfitobacteriaceae bacterium]